MSIYPRYKAQRSLLADVDAGKIAREEFFARAEELLKERMPKPAAAHKPAEARPSPAVATTAAVRVPTPDPPTGDPARATV